MAVPHTSTQFADLLDPRFQRIWNDTYPQLPDMVSQLYTMQATNGRNDMRWSSVGAFGDIPQFTGSVTYDDVSQGYDTTMTPLEFASGVQVERKLFDDDQYGIMDQRPVGLARAYNRTRQPHAFRLLNNAFSVDTFFYNNSEGVALCSNSHTTTSGASTASGFDNLVTSALSATAVTAARIQMMGFRDDRANRIQTTPSAIYHPVDLYDVAEEIVKSAGKPTDATNAVNVHHNGYTLHSSVYMTDTNNWFMTDESLRRECVFWSDRVGVEFAMIEDFDTLVAKWRLYARYGMAWRDWRFILGASVS